MAMSRTAQQMNAFASLMKSAAGRATFASKIGPSLRRRRDYLSIARKAVMVETLQRGALPVYDKEFDETGRSFVEAFMIGEEGGNVIVRRNPKRVMVNTFEIASNPMIPISQIEERRFDYVARSLNLAKAAVGETEDKYIFRLFDAINKKASTRPADDPLFNPPIALTTGAVNKTDMADAFGQIQRHDVEPSYVFLNPRDYVDILKWEDKEVDRETQRQLLKTGIMGYLWGSTLLRSRLVKQGEVYVLADKEFLGVMPERIPLTVVSADNPGLRQIGFSVFEILGCLIFAPSSVQKLVKP